MTRIRFKFIVNHIRRYFKILHFPSAISPLPSHLIGGVNLDIVEGTENNVSGFVPRVQVKANTSGIVLILERDDLPSVALPGIALVGR